MAINMSKFTYKTKDGTKTGFIPGVGAIIDGQIESDTLIESPNLMLVKGYEPQQPEAPVVATASQQNPNQPATAESSAPNNAGVQQ